MIEIKERIKILRKNKNLSQDAFGEKLGMTGASISRYEAGTREVTDATIKHIAKTFGISESWLRTGEGEMEERDLLAELTARYQLGPAGQALLRAVARVFSEFDEETASRIVDDVLAELQSSVAARAVVVADPSSRAVSDPQSPADQESSSSLPGSVVG